MSKFLINNKNAFHTQSPFSFGEGDDLEYGKILLPMYFREWVTNYSLRQLTDAPT